MTQNGHFYHIGAAFSLWAEKATILIFFVRYAFVNADAISSQYILVPFSAHS